VLEERKAAQPLSIEILPAMHQRLIGEVEGALEIGQSNHQLRGFGRTSERAINAAGLLVAYDAGA
jgi:hypothetical protein